MGAIGCTHVPLFPPSHKEHIYRNHKGYQSMNIQVVCDAQMFIQDVMTGFPGSVHSAHIFWQSQLFENFDKGTVDGGWLLGK